MKATLILLITFGSFFSWGQTDLDSVIYKHPVMVEQLELIQQNSCNYRPHYEMPSWPDLRPQKCDSLRPLFIDELYRAFTPEQLFELVQHSGNYHIQLYSFHAFCQSPYKADSVIAYFEKRFSAGRNLWHFHSDAGYQLIVSQLGIVSPQYAEYYPKTNKLNLEDYTYLSSIFQRGRFTSGIFNVRQDSSPETTPTFYFLNQLDFGKIDLSYHTAGADTFELRSKIAIRNVTNKVITVAPYYGSSIHFDKLSYRVPAQGEIEIPFSCIVVLSELKGPIKRTIKFEDYTTKYATLFSFNADFIQDSNVN